MGLAAGGFLTLPRADVPFYSDEWCFLRDIQTHGLAAAVFMPTAEHFLPVFKAVYGSLLVLSGFSNQPIMALQLAFRTSSLLLWFALLKERVPLGYAETLPFIAVGFGEVGVAGVFRWPWELALEQSLLLTTLSVFCVVRSVETASRRWALAAGSTTLLGCLTFPSSLAGAGGLVLACLATSAAGAPRRVVRCVFWSLAIGMSAGAVVIAGLSRPQTPGLQLGPIAQYFFYLNFVHSGLAGLRPGMFRGLVTTAFSIALVTLALAIVWRKRQSTRALLFLSLLLIPSGMSLITAVARWQYGLPHSGSARYVYVNVFFGMILLAAVMGGLSEWQCTHNAKTSGIARLARLVLGAGVLLMSLRGAVSGLAEARGAEDQRKACLAGLLSGGAEPEACASALAWGPGAATVREVWRKALAERAERPW